VTATRELAGGAPADAGPFDLVGEAHLVLLGGLAAYTRSAAGS
jgi:hypothetical protein